MTKVAILGGSGYTALELIKILLHHPAVQIVAITSRQAETPLIAEVHPSLLERIDLRCEAFNPESLAARGVECAFSCLPHGVSMESAAALAATWLAGDRFERGLSTARSQRLCPMVWRKPSRPGLSHPGGLWVAGGLWRRITHGSAGCQSGLLSAGAILGLAPLLTGRHIDLKSIIIDSKSGVSGAGRTPKLDTHFPECNESVHAYGVGKHRHTPEIEQALTDLAGEPVEVLFTPHLIPMNRGIFSTIYATPRRPFTDQQLLELYRHFFSQAPFVRVVNHLPATKDCLGTNFLDIAVRFVRGRIVVLACEDNLIRGASGVAVQNFNRMYGHDERTALL